MGVEGALAVVGEDRKEIKSKIEFVLKHDVEYFTSKIKDVIKILRERPDGDDTEILDLLYNKKISVGDALLSGRVNNLHINLNDMIREFLKSKCRTNTMAMAVDVSLFDPTYLSGRSRLKYRSKIKGTCIWIYLLLINYPIPMLVRI